MIGKSKLVIWNPSAGGAENADDVRRRLHAMSRVSITTPTDPEATLEAVGRAADDGVELVIAAGGDGTVSAVAGAMMQASRQPMLGILPLGTGNDLARSLSIPANPLEALGTLMQGTPREIDLFETSTSRGLRITANMLTGGNTGRYLSHMSDEVKERWGPLCYLRGVLDVVRDLQVFRIEVCCDEEPPETFDALNVFMANGRFSGGGLAVSPNARLDDGRIDLVVVNEGEAGDIASLTSRYVLADYLEHELITFRRARRIELRSDPPMPLTSDGDPLGETPLTVMMKQRALTVVAPPSGGD